MRKIVFALSFLLITVAGISQKKITITGTISDADAEEIIFTHLDSEKQDKSAIDEKGKFSFETEASKADFYQLSTGKEDFTILVLEPGDKLHIVLDGKDLTKPIEVKGSKQTEFIFNTLSKAKKHQKTIDSINTVYQEYYRTPKQDSMTNILLPLYKDVAAKKKDAIRKEVETNSSLLACLIFLEDFDIQDDFDLFDKIDKGIYEKHKDNAYVQNHHKKVDMERKLQIGKVAPEIELPNPDGGTTKLSSLRGNVVLIDFWASWCGPCRRENPNMVRIYNRFKDQGFTVFGVSLDKSKEKWLEAIKKDQLSWPHVSDLKGWQSEGGQAYGVSSIPFTVLLDKEGKILAKGLRGEELEKKLEEIFN